MLEMVDALENTNLQTEQALVNQYAQKEIVVCWWSKYKLAGRRLFRSLRHSMIPSPFKQIERQSSEGIGI